MRPGLLLEIPEAPWFQQVPSVSRVVALPGIAFAHAARQKPRAMTAVPVVGGFRL